MKQDELASVIGLRQPSVSRWEKGRALPGPMEQSRYRALMDDHIRTRARARPLILLPALARALVHATPTSSLLDRKARILDAGAFVKRGFAARDQHAVGTLIIGLATENALGSFRDWFPELHTKNSPILSVSFDDLSLLRPGVVLRRTWTAVDIGDGERVVFNSDRFSRVGGQTDLPPCNLTVLTEGDL